MQTVPVLIGAWLTWSTYSLQHRCSEHSWTHQKYKQSGCGYSLDEPNDSETRC